MEITAWELACYREITTAKSGLISNEMHRFRAMGAGSRVAGPFVSAVDRFELTVLYLIEAMILLSLYIVA